MTDEQMEHERKIREWYIYPKANAVHADMQLVLAQLDAARQQLADEKERADGNFQSYERIKDRFSDCSNQLRASEQQVERLRKGAQRMARFHHDTCSSSLDNNYACDCGKVQIDAALADGAQSSDPVNKPMYGKKPTDVVGNL